MARKPKDSTAKPPGEPARKPRAVSLDDFDTGQAQAPAAETRAPRKPRAEIRLARLEPVPDEAAQGLADSLTPPPPSQPPRRGFSWGAMLFAALAGLLSLGIGLAVDQLIRDLFARQDWLGWTAAALAALAVLAAIALVLREALAILRLRAIAGHRQHAEQARADNDRKLANRLMKDLQSLYADNPETAQGRTALEAHRGEIIDGADLVDLIERDLMGPLDAKAAGLVMNSAKRVSIVTAVSPRALIDLAFVLMENMRLIRRLSQLYGGRPGALGFMRLTRNVLVHLATTGAIAVGDGLVQQLIGHGLAARLSARLGEGVVNGLLTARIGIAAIDVCRPMPFEARKRPGVADFMGELVKIVGGRREPEE